VGKKGRTRRGVKCKIWKGEIEEEGRKWRGVWKKGR